MKLLLFASMILVSISSYSQFVFQKEYKGQFTSSGWSSIGTFDSGYIITGSDYGGTGNDDNVYLIKVDSLGGIIWTKKYGGQELDRGFGVNQTADSGYVIAGFSLSYNLGATDPFLIKTNGIGDTIWTKRYQVGAGNNYSNYVEQCQDGGYTFSGTYNPVGFNGSFIAKTNNFGNIVWAKYFETGFWLKCPPVHQTTDKGFIYTTQIDSPVGNTNIYLLKTDSMGSLMWSKMYDLGGSDHGFAVRQTADGGYILCGVTIPLFFDSYVSLIKTDSVGNVLWARVYGGSNDDYGFDVIQTTDGGYALTGSTAYGSGSGDAYLIKTDSLGNLLWSKTYSNIAGVGHSIQQTLDNGFIISGSGAANGSVYIIKTDSLGNSGCNQYDPTTLVSIPNVITYFPSTVFNNATFNIDSTGFVIGSGGEMTTLCETGVVELSLFNSILIYPNPNSGKFIISSSKTLIKAKIEVYNILGNKIYSAFLNGNLEHEVELAISTGIYFIKIYDGERSYCKKLIVEHN
jgi:hypothetical protein